MTDDEPCVRVVDAAPIERFLRANGAAVVRLAGDPARYLINARVTLDEAGLLTMANMKRRRAGLAPFVWGQRAEPAPGPGPVVHASMKRRPRPISAPPAPPPARASGELLRVKILAADLALELAAARAQGKD